MVFERSEGFPERKTNSLYKSEIKMESLYKSEVRKWSCKVL
jgi:hypothetical protein